MKRFANVIETTKVLAAKNGKVLWYVMGWKPAAILAGWNAFLLNLIFNLVPLREIPIQNYVTSAAGGISAAAVIWLVYKWFNNPLQGRSK